MPDYLERSRILALLDAAQQQQSASAKAEEEKAAGNLGKINSHRWAAQVLVDIADTVRELPAASVKGEKED